MIETAPSFARLFPSNKEGVCTLVDGSHGRAVGGDSRQHPRARAPGNDGRGGRPWRDPRDVLNGILWVLRTGAPWADLPRRYPPYQTCHDRFQKWEREGVLDRVLTALAEDLRQRGKLDLTEAYIDGTHAGAKRGALMLGSLAAAKRPRSCSS